MAEIFSLSGSYDELGAPPSVTDQRCALTVKTPVILGMGARVTSIGTGLFGAYKLLKGRPTPGIVALIGGGLLWFAGGRLLDAAERSFEECRKS